MSQDNWSKVESLFAAGLEMPIERRIEFWRRECGADQGMLAELEKLQRGHERAEKIEFMEKAIWSPRVTNELDGNENMNGKKIGGYEVLRLLGQGGMGDVYLAKKPPLTREVVIKLVKHPGNSAIHKQFLAEMRVHEKLKHDNIVMLLDAGLHDQSPYLVLDYFPSQSLRDFLRAPGPDRGQRPLPLDQVLEITKQIAAGLGYAHREHRITHRDIKPENILIDDKALPIKVKVIDFGIAILPEMAMTLLDGQTTRRPTVGASGTPVYMSPEQIQNGIARRKVREIDWRSDIYSLGLLIYEMLTGRLAFPSEAHRYYQDMVWPSQLRPELSQQVDEVLKKTLKENPDARYQSTDELCQALAAALTAPTLPPKKDMPLPARYWKATAGFLSAAGLGAALWIGNIYRPDLVHTLTPTPSVIPTAGPTLSPMPVEAANQFKISLLEQDANGQPVPVGIETVFRNTPPTARSGGLRIEVDVERRGYLYIVEEADSGRIDVLYPDPQRNGENRPVSAGETVFLPKRDAWFRFKGKSGTDSIYVVFGEAKDDPMLQPIETALKAGKRSIDIANGGELLSGLRRRAEELTPSSGAPNQGSSKVIKGAGMLVGVLKLRHEQ